MFVAVSAAEWGDAEVGLHRLEVTFRVEGNEPPDRFDVDAFMQEQQRARETAGGLLRRLSHTWNQWEQGELGIRETCDEMCADLGRLRQWLERYPRLDGGRWWARLGGFHMNVHKLPENTLFECELYIGHALTFGDAEVRSIAERNLEGCYQKRLLEAARFLWMDGIELMMRADWSTAMQILRRAAAKKNGWGWAVNYGDIWLSEAAAQLVLGAQRETNTGSHAHDVFQGHDEEDIQAGLEAQGIRAPLWIAHVERLVQKSVERTDEAGAFGLQGHPWAIEIAEAVAAYRSLWARGADTAQWLEAFKQCTIYWCAQVLSGTPPFPPKPRPRLGDAATLVRRLPGHND